VAGAGAKRLIAGWHLNGGKYPGLRKPVTVSRREEPVFRAEFKVTFKVTGPKPEGPPALLV
jgi:hypothetical protein